MLYLEVYVPVVDTPSVVGADVDASVVSTGVEGTPVVVNPGVDNIVVNSSIVVVKMWVTGDVSAVDNLDVISVLVVVSSGVS